MMNTDLQRAKELREYLELLLHLKASGFNVDNKVKDVLNALHNAMGFLNVEPYPVVTTTTGVGMVGVGTWRDGGTVKGMSTSISDANTKNMLFSE